MPVKMSRTCTRCHRESVELIPTLAEAQAVEAREMQAAETLKKLQDFVTSLPEITRPDFFAIIGGEVLVHSFLCDKTSPEDPKRSCAQRVSDLLKGVLPHGPRQPRSKNKKKKGSAAAAAAAGNGAEAALETPAAEETVAKAV